MHSVCFIAILVCFALIYTVLAHPSIKIGEYRFFIPYWAVTMVGSLSLLIFGLLSWKTVWYGLTSAGSINPLKILVLFISMTTLSIYLDEVGFFSYMAGVSLKAAKASQFKLFSALYLLVSVLTVFTSNDIIILTFTPFICCFSKKADIDPMPYLFGEFVAANTWSMMLIIGNPTNIYLSTAAGISFGAYTLRMFLPTLMAGLVSFVMLLLVFRKKLSKPASISEKQPTLQYKGIVVIGLIHLIGCTVLLVISSYINFEMWYIALGFAVSLLIWVTIYKKKKHIKHKVVMYTLVRAPWELIPFVLSMFIIVLALEQYNVTEVISNFFGTDCIVYKYGLASFLTANVMNNIPMAVAFSSIAGYLPEAFRLQAVYASVIGSNIGAYFTPLGALAGIMWSGILKKMGIEVSFKKYISYGVRISLPVLFVALFFLNLVLR